MKSQVFLCAALAVFFSSLGCQSTSGFPDKSADIQTLENQNKSIVANQEDVLAPAQYEEFSENLKEAQSLNSAHKDASKAVQKAQEASASLASKSKPTKAVLAQTLAARQKALDSGAGESSTFQKIDKDLKSATQDAAKGDIKAIQSESTELQNRYANAEGDAIVSKTIGTDTKKFATLKANKAEAVAPTTYQRTEAKLADAERSIRADRYNPQTQAAARAIADAEVARLEKITSDASRLKNEPAAIELFEKDAAAVALKTQNEATAQALKDQNDAKGAGLASQATSLATQNNELKTQLNASQTDQNETAAKLSTSEQELKTSKEATAQKEKLEQKFVDAKKLFDPHEAEVFKDGENLLIRLKGLRFAQGKGALPAESQAILKKLSTVVAEFQGAHVRIEGHTDSTGTVATNARLSQERAGIVKSYLVQQNKVQDDNVVVQGMGEAGPVATNKTAAGRAQNRRVDVIVQPAY